MFRQLIFFLDTWYIKIAKNILTNKIGVAQNNKTAAGQQITTVQNTNTDA